MSPKIQFGKREFHLPRSRPLRVGAGILLIIGGILGFLPVLGFWMIPLGLLVLSVDIPIVRRWRRRLVVWWHRRKEQRERTKAPASRSRQTAGRAKEKSG